ncbi:MAG: hypothetical protein IJ716_14470 [Lachnospiraceae bacterium]|nr:hypothetical protein [Lachnospiraceae bacterium]
MAMIKVCDICGKQIGKRDDFYKLALINGENDFIKKSYEVCKDCSNELLAARNGSKEE